MFNVRKDLLFYWTFFRELDKHIASCFHELKWFSKKLLWSQAKHLEYLILSWTDITHVFNFLLSENLFLQIEQLYGSIFSWTSSKCFFSALFSKQLKSQFWYLCSFLFLWTEFMCLLKWLFMWSATLKY